MKLTELMDLKGICVGISLKEKDGVIDILAALQQKCGNIEQSKILKQDIFYREEQGSTAIGAGVAIPHVRSSAVKHAGITAVTVPAGVDFEAPDGEKSRLIFLVALPEEGGENPLSKLTVLLMNEDLREQLADAANEEAFLELLRLAEDGEYGEQKRSAVDAPVVLAVVNANDTDNTQALVQMQSAAERLGILLKTELHGSENSEPFSDQEIAQAKGVILIGGGLSADRFDGKPILEAAAQDGIHRPEHLLHMVGEAPVFYKKTEPGKRDRQLRHPVFKTRIPLLPLLVLSGGAMILTAFITNLLGADAAVSAFFLDIGRYAYLLILPVMSGLIAFRYARWPGLAVGICGGILLEQSCGGVWAALLGGMAAGLMMRGFGLLGEKMPSRVRALTYLFPVIGLAGMGVLSLLLARFSLLLERGLTALVTSMQLPWAGGLLLSALSALDPGGPLNRAALNFAAESAAAGEWMAAITAGSLALTLGVTVFAVFRSKYMDPVQRENGWFALLAGLCGYTNAYIPFAAGDPFRILLSCMTGAAAAGLLSVWFGCSVSSAIGGVFAMSTAGRPWWLLLAGIIGAALNLGLLIWASKITQKRLFKQKKQQAE